MDKKSVGATIERLRIQKRMTQKDLANLLAVSNKTISKWETGGGFPDVTFFPELAKIFGVSIDYLMTGNTADD
jgi:transcriptional regulator with XRE-family HTH domain